MDEETNTGVFKDDSGNVSIVTDTGKAEEGDKQAEEPKPYSPLGGATSYEDLEATEEIREWKAFVCSEVDTLHTLLSNIAASEEISPKEKGASVSKVVDKFKQRLGAGPPKEGQRSIFAKAMQFVARLTPDQLKGVLDAEKTMVPTHKPPTSQEKTWDGDAAVGHLKKWASSDGSGKKETINWTKFRGGFATYDPGNADSFGGYHYPHHDIEGGKFVVSRAGVRAAFQRASQQKDTAAQRHLQPHREQFGFGQRMLGSFTAFKDLFGAWRWLSVTTNKFKDREGEIFREKAHRQYVAWADFHKEYPELWLWHTEGSRIGQADYVAYNDDGFVVHSGVFDDDMQDVAERLSESKGLAVSHGFYYEEGDEEDGIYDWYKTFEVSVLPAKRAANAYTAFTANSKEERTMLSAEKRQFLVDKWGEPRTVELEEKLASLSGELKEAGIEFKDLVEEVPGTEADDSKPAEETKGDSEPETPEPLTAEGVKAIVEEAVAPVVEAIPEAISEATKPLEERLAQLERSDEEKIVNLMSPRRKTPGDDQRPSQSDDTKVEDQEAIKKALEEGEGGDPVAPYVNDLTQGRVTQATGRPPHPDAGE